MNYLNIVLQFMISGAVVVIATFLSKNFDSKWGGLIAAAPHIITLTIIFVYLNTNIQNTQKLITSLSVFVVPVFIFLLVIYIFLPKTNLFLAVFFAYLAYFIFAAVMNLFID